MVQSIYNYGYIQSFDLYGRELQKVKINPETGAKGLDYCGQCCRCTKLDGIKNADLRAKLGIGIDITNS